MKNHPKRTVAKDAKPPAWLVSQVSNPDFIRQTGNIRAGVLKAGLSGFLCAELITGAQQANKVSFEVILA
jgi:hypothetical protein